MSDKLSTELTMCVCVCVCGADGRLTRRMSWNLRDAKLQTRSQEKVLGEAVMCGVHPTLGHWTEESEENCLKGMILFSPNPAHTPIHPSLPPSLQPSLSPSLPCHSVCQCCESGSDEDNTISKTLRCNI